MKINNLVFTSSKFEAENKNRLKINSVLFSVNKLFNRLKISFLFFAVIVFLSNSFSQEKIRLVYSETTSLAIDEMRNLLNNNELEISLALDKIRQLESQGKIILSTSEYAPIKSRIDYVKPKSMNDLEIENKD